MESIELAITRSLTAARLYADENKNEYHYRFVSIDCFNSQIENYIIFSKRKMELKALVKKCQNWREEFDKDFKVCFVQE